MYLQQPVHRCRKVRARVLPARILIQAALVNQKRHRAPGVGWRRQIEQARWNPNGYVVCFSRLRFITSTSAICYTMHSPPPPPSLFYLNGPDTRPSGRRNSCQKRNLFVSFRDLGWQVRIFPLFRIKPASCSGGCHSLGLGLRSHRPLYIVWRTVCRCCLRCISSFYEDSPVALVAQKPSADCLKKNEKKVK